MYFQKPLSVLLVLCFLAQNIFFFSPMSVFAAPDPDGSANIDLYLTPVVPASSLIGKNFTLDISLENKNTSDGDGFRPGLILSLPTGVSLISAGVLGTPVRSVSHASGSTLLFFETTQIALKGVTMNFPITLSSTNAAGVFINKNIGVLAYADDSIYGRGAAPSGSPPGTLTGGIDFASGSGVNMADTTDLTFPNTINSSTNLSTLPFVIPSTLFTPFDVVKTEPSMNLIGIPMVTTLRVLGNSMGPLKNFHLQDVIPSNRGFSGILSVVGGTVGGVNITYDLPSVGEVTLDLTDISVPTGSDISIMYETIPLAYDAVSYSVGLPVLDTGSVISHRDPSPNIVTMHTGGLALSGGPYSGSTWNNGASDILVDTVSIVPPRVAPSTNRYANLAKSSDISSAVIGDIVTYTVDLTTAMNAAFTTNGSGSYIVDTLPDGLTFSGTVSSIIASGTGTPLTFISSNTDINGDTSIIWRLNSGYIGANSMARIVYQAVLDGAFEGAGKTVYENTATLTNDASFFGTVGDGGLSGIWGMTDSSIIDTSVYIHATNTDNAIATVGAPVPIMKKNLISITLPSGAVYDYSTGFPTNIPSGSALRFALTMDFPNVNFINPNIIDALPLLAGPNTSAYNIAFQTNTNLKDIYNTGVLFNTNDGVSPASDFNGLNLAGTSIPNAPWIAATPANNLEFQLNSGVGKKTFAILFTVDILSSKPVGGISNTGLVPLTNYAYSTYNNDVGTKMPLPVMDIPFTVNFPSVIATKTASGGNNVEAGKDIEYTITLTNMGTSPAFLENLIDTLPADMDYMSGSIVSSGSLVSLPDTSFTQSGNILAISFDTGSTGTGRSYIPLDNTGTLGVQENIVVISYSVRPNTNFVIQGGASRTNTVTLDYYASSGALSNGVNNLGPVTTSANVNIKSPILSRSIASTSETDSAGINLLVGEEVVYHTVITVPNGTFDLANYAETINSNLQFISGSVLAYSGSLGFAGSTTFSGSSVPFGTITNTDIDIDTLETIIVETTYRTKNTALAGTNYVNNGIFTYSSTSTASALNINIVKPVITLTKLVSPFTGDAGDVVTYTITANNTSTTAPVYDVRITDLLPSYITYVTGSILPGVFSGTDIDLFLTSGSGNGLSLDVIPVSSGATFTFQAIFNDNVRPGDAYINRADIVYDTLDDDSSLYESTESTFATALVNVQDITLDHIITSTSLPDTTSALFSGSIVDLAIGEHVLYTTTLGFPEAIATGVTLTQTLPTSMKFLSGYILIDGVKTHTLSNIVIGPDSVITFSLGDIDNVGVGAGTGMTIVTEAVLLDNAANTAGSTKTSSMQVNYSEKSKSTNTFVEVVEPALSIVKDYSPNTGDAGDTIPVTITLTNTSQVYAYDVVFTDVPPSKLTPGVGYSGTINIGTLAPGQVVIFTYNNVISGSAGPGEILTGTSSVVYTSYPGSPTEGERSYSAVDNDFVTVVTPGSIILSLLSSSDVKIGDISQYQIRVPVGEGLVNTLSVSSLLPPGMVIIPGSVNITTDPSITYSGTVIPLPSVSSDSITAGSPQTISYIFTGVDNTNTDNGTTEYIFINYDAILMNSTDTNNGDIKSHSVTALYDGVDTKSGASLPVTVREPNVVLTVSNSYAYSTTVPYIFTIVNSGSSTAYDLDLSTLLPVGVTYTGTLTLINSGGAINLSQLGDTFRLDSLPVNAGNPLVFMINGAIDSFVPNFTPLTLTGTVIYTSEPGSYSPQTVNVLNTERTSIGGVDDYIDANKTNSFILNIPLLDESISILDVNGGDGIIGDIFEYAITLTNTGNVALSAIPVTLDIPAGFTGFTMISTPAGSADLSTSSGGMNNVGSLSISGINIPVGQSRTIVYRVTARTDMTPGTVIPTLAAVGNSFEGATGGTPNVPVTINAPLLISNAVERDVNEGGKLLRDETIEHIITLTNTGTATGTNVIVTIPWTISGATYISGSLVFQSGTLVDTGSVFIDIIQGTISFTIPVLPRMAIEVFHFRTLTTGPVGSQIDTRISAQAQEGVRTDTVSNILIIVNDTPGSGGSGGSPIPPSIPILPPLSIPPEKPVVTPPQKTLPKPPKSIIKQITPNSLESEYIAYLKFKKRLSALIEEENTAGVKGIISPKTLPQTGKSILSRVKKLISMKLSLEAPEFKKGGDTLASYLENLPKEDQSRDEYIVLPSNGMITPINTVQDGTSDYKKLVNGREIDVNKYLKTGVMTYPGTNTAGFGGIGNTVIFGHSSYWKSDSGRYKTHFQKIIELEAGEEIWIYKKQIDASYKRYRYSTSEFYEVKPTDVAILNPGIGKNLTLFTCTPIGGINGRWVVQAKFIDEDKLHIEDLLYGNSLPNTEKKEIQSYFSGLKNLSLEEKKKNLLTKYDTISLQDKTPYTRYYTMQIAKAYMEAK